MNKELATSIGLAAREARKTLQLTQEDAAERIGVSVEFYARIERGTSLPSIETFARIVSALNVSADILLGRHMLVPAANQPRSWTPAPPTDAPEVRRLTRRLRKATPSTLRLISLVLKELDRSPAGSDDAFHDGHLEPANRNEPIDLAEADDSSVDSGLRAVVAK